MAHRDLKIRPGVDLQATQTENQIVLSKSNLIRFHEGHTQPLFGWLPLTNQTFVGTCRGLHGWSDVPGNPYIAVGTDQRLQVLSGGGIYDITPVAQTDNPAVSVSTTLGSTTVSLIDVGYAPNVGDWFYTPTHIAVGGIVLFGFYQVTALGGGSSFSFVATPAATATVTNGGAVASYTTTLNSSTVKVTLAAHGLVTGSVYVPGVSTTIATVTVAAITSYSVTLVDANNFNITVTGTANATATASENSGNAQIQYLLPSGVTTSYSQQGYGAGDYGGGDYGGVQQTGATGVVALRQWSLDHFGQYLIASPSGGKIYQWVPPTIGPATVVSGSAPLFSTAVFVMPQSQIVFALGAETGGTQQPLLARWSDAGDQTAWTATATNQAGSKSMTSGSALVGGLPIGLGAAIWTDTGLFSVNYLGYPLVFGFQPVASGCGLMAQRAAGVIGNLVMWMTPQLQFFVYTMSGMPQPVHCTVHDFLRLNVDLTQTGQIHCAVNEDFNEFAWHFPLSASSPLYGANTLLAYVKYNIVEKAWDYGVSSQYQRTAWTGRNPLGKPVGADTAGLLQQHEVGYDANGTAMMWSWQSGYFDIPEGGEMFAFSDYMLPDFNQVGSPVLVPNIQVTDTPNGTPTTVVTYPATIASGVNALTYSARGRQMTVGFSASASNQGSFARLGRIRYRWTPDGRF